MIIKELAFASFCKVFKKHDSLIDGIGFTNRTTVNVLLTSEVTWHITRYPDTGEVLIWCEESKGHEAHSFLLKAEDFCEITIC